MLTIIIAITALLFGSKSGVQTRRSHWVATSVLSRGQHCQRLDCESGKLIKNNW